jgi:hypothetical protein
MATDQVGESRDVGTLLQGEQQVLEMIATGAPLAAELDALCRAKSSDQGTTGTTVRVRLALAKDAR